MGAGTHGEPVGRTLGQYLASRLKEIGVRSVFAIPGDFNMALLVSLESLTHSHYSWSDVLLRRRCHT